MQVTDTIADMLTRIRNASFSKHDSVQVPASKIKIAIADILYKEGYIAKYEVLEDKKQGMIKIFLKYVDAKKRPVIMGIKRVSKPGLRLYYSCKNLPKVLKGLGIAIVSTSKGLMVDRKARKENIGGEVLAFVW